MAIDIKDSELKLLKNYLNKRLNTRSIKEGLSVVFDLTYFCNLQCKGCAVNARYIKEDYVPDDKLELDTRNVIYILEKIYEFVEISKITPFYLNFGGGEPFLRNDIKVIVKKAAELFGRESIAIDTNGTVVKIQDLLEVFSSISSLGISIDGFENYHNQWRGMTNELNSYDKSMSLLQKILGHERLRNIVEVTSIVTKNNFMQIPAFIKMLDEIGVQKYSTHRAFPVGRMAKNYDIILDPDDYLKHAIDIAYADHDYAIDCHFHHSLESIYASIILNINTYVADRVLGNPDSRSSFGIDPKGNIYFDPWCMVKPWNSLFGGNLLDESFDFDSLISDKGVGMLSIAKKYSVKSVRCEGCSINCSGGSRIAASAEYLRSIKRKSLSDLLIGMSKIDPACPLEKRYGRN